MKENAFDVEPRHLPVSASDPGPSHPAATPGRPVQPTRIPRGGLLVLAGAGFIAVTTELLPAGLLPQISRDLGVPESSVGSLTAAYAAIIIFTALPLSRFLNGRVSRKVLLIAAILAFSFSNVLLAFSPNLTTAVVSRLLGGVAHGLLWSTMAPYTSRIVPAKSLGKAMAIVFSGVSIAMAAGTPIGTMIGTLLTWRSAFLVLAGVGAFLGLLAIWVLPRAPFDKVGVKPSVRRAIAQPGVIAVATAWPLMLLAHFTLFTYIAPFVRASGLPDAATGISLSVVGASGLVGIWVAGLTADSHPRRSLLITVSLIVTSFVLFPVFSSTWIGCLILMATWGAGLGAVGIYNQAAILRAGGEHRDAANGLTVVTVNVGLSAGALFGALALNTFGALILPFAAAVPMAAALVIVLLGRHHAYPAGLREKGERA